MGAPDGRTILESWEYQGRVEYSKGRAIKARDPGNESRSSASLRHNTRHVDDEVESGSEHDPQNLEVCSHRYRGARRRVAWGLHSPLCAEAHSGTFGMAESEVVGNGPVHDLRQVILKEMAG